MPTITKRGIDGKFVKGGVNLSSAEAAAMGSKAHKTATIKGTLLEEAGYSSPEDAPEHLRVLAEIAASKRSGAVPAMRDFLRLTARYVEDPTTKMPTVHPGEKCPTCGQYYAPHLSGAAWRLIAERVGELEAGT